MRTFYSNHIFLLLLAFVFSSINDVASSSSVTTTTHRDKSDAKTLSAHWLLQLDTDDIDEARRLAREHNFNVIRPVNAKLLPGYYVVESEHHTSRARRDVDTTDLKELIESSARKINDHPSVVSFGREKVLSRKKRDYMTPIEQQNLMMIRGGGGVNNMHSLRLSRSDWKEDDPLWPQMWYLNRQATTGLPDMNVSAAWAQGASGRGVSVTFLDDGLEWNHPDLQPNYDPLASTDINSHDDDPMPRYEETNENKHGTRCAGEVAAVANNSVCSVGVAFHAGIGGIRMLDGDVTDSVEASSLSFNSQHVAIYSASWGPDDNGEVVDGPGPLAKKAFVDGVFTGRKGLGNIFVWASGNGGRFNDSCSCDGYANSIYTLSISSVSERGEKPWYLEECASTLATTYSSGDERAGEKEIVTTDLRHKCTSKHTGTSAAAPLAAGIIALTLEVNPILTWRDIMYLVVVSSRPHAIKSNNYFVNKRGFLVSSRYGFGLMDAGRMVELAKTWRLVPPLQTCSTLNSNYKQRSIQRPNGIEAVLTTDACKRTVNEVNFIEQVEVIVSIKAPRRGALEIYLTSPMGTRHVLLPQRSRDTSPDGFTMWGFTTVQLWGEMPQGDWVLYVNDNSGATIELGYYQLIIHGTKDMPIDYDKYVRPNLDSSQETSNSNKCEGSLLEWSDDTSGGDHHSVACTSYCPLGYYADFALARCVKCDQSCLDCSGPGSKKCISCSADSFLKLDTGECVSVCPTDDGYFINYDSQCEKCDLNCLSCKYESNYCQSCVEKSQQQQQQLVVNQTLDSVITVTLSHNQCVLVNTLVSCDQGTYYETSRDECGFCDITCETCSSSEQNKCLSCETRRPYLSQGLCVDECEPGSFQIDSEPSRCFKCHSSCETCQLKSNNCLKCKPGFRLNENNQCLATYLYNGKCGDSNCFECYAADPTKCTICKKNYALSEFDQKCLDKPPEGVYFHSVLDGKGTRLVPSPCPSSCSRCLENSTCTQCADGFHLFPATGQCQVVCQEKYFYSSERQKCLPCDLECDSCSSLATKCTKCPVGKFLHNDRCLDRCPLNFFGDSTRGQCFACHPSCDTCTGTKKSDCLTCGVGFAFNGHECVSQCPETTYFDVSRGECSMCDQTVCKWCIRTATTCTLCADSSFALDESSHTCRPCCSRSIRGKIKYNATCCACAEIPNGVCLNLTRVADYVPTSEKMSDKEATTSSFVNSQFYTFFSFVIILLAVCLLVFSGFSFYKSIQKAGTSNFSDVRYRYLNGEEDNDESLQQIIDDN